MEHGALAAQLQHIQSLTKNVVKKDGAGGFDFVSGRYFQPLIHDYDADGRPDIILTVDFGSPRLLKNVGSFSFSDVTSASGLDYAGTTMGVSVSGPNAGDYQNIIMTNVLGDFLFAEKPDHTFALTDGNVSRLGFGWGVAFLDYDLDGREDVYITNGDSTLSAGIPHPDLARAYFRNDKLYRNDGGGHFVDAWGDLPPDVLSGKSVAVSDYDNNGTPDIFISTIALRNVEQPQHNLLYINTEKDKHYLKIRLRGIESNSFGIGSEVSVTGEAGMQTKFVTIGGGFYSENSTRLLFGLGTSTAPVDVGVTWPSGRRTLLRSVPIDREIHITEDEL